MSGGIFFFSCCCYFPHRSKMGIVKTFTINLPFLNISSKKFLLITIDISLEGNLIYPLLLFRFDFSYEILGMFIKPHVQTQQENAIYRAENRQNKQKHDKFVPVNEHIYTNYITIT